jgi:hypothetical protein
LRGVPKASLLKSKITASALRYKTICEVIKMINIPGFYPTAKPLIDKMVSDIDFKTINSILEPEAGKGDIVDRVVEKMKASHYNGYREEYTADIDTVEINENLRHILKGKKYRVIHDDFLTLDTYKHYDLIIANPPFEDGDKHLLKMLEMQKDGGKIRCLLNAETIKNAYSNSRKDLVRKLDECDAKIEYIQNAFIDAERKTGVEVALIRIDIPAAEKRSVILDDLKREEYFQKSVNNSGEIIDADPLVNIVNRYNFEVRAGLKLIDEYEAMTPYLLHDIKEGTGSTIMVLTDGSRDNKITRNQYIKAVRYKYWKTLFLSDIFVNIFTSKLRTEYMNKVNELQNYDFSLYNIRSLQAEIVKTMSASIEETIMALFDEFSHKYHWHEETGNNIHYYNGWKTNQSWFINKRIIIPWHGCYSLDYQVKDRLADIEKVFNYLDGGRTDHVDLMETIKRAKDAKQTAKIKLKYFLVTVYKKGTCHIEFTNLELLKKFNLFGAMHKNWLPPSYGKAKYEDMTPDERAVIDDFEGEAEYRKVMAKRDYYICESIGLPMLEERKAS